MTDNKWSAAEIAAAPSEAQRIADRLAAPNLTEIMGAEVPLETVAQAIAETDLAYKAFVDALPEGNLTEFNRNDAGEFVSPPGDDAAAHDEMVQSWMPGSEGGPTLPGIPTGPRTFKVQTLVEGQERAFTGLAEIGPRALGRATADMIKAAQVKMAESVSGASLVMVGDVVLTVSVQLAVRCLPEEAGITSNVPEFLSAVTVN